jgi:hypothetical protein
VSIADADHNDEALLAGDEMVQAVTRFVQELFPDDLAADRGSHVGGLGDDDIG